MQHKLGTAYKGHEIFVSATLSVYHFFVKVSSEKIYVYIIIIQKSTQIKTKTGNMENSKLL